MPFYSSAAVSYKDHDSTIYSTFHKREKRARLHLADHYKVTMPRDLLACVHGFAQNQVYSLFYDSNEIKVISFIHSLHKASRNRGNFF